MWGSMSERVMSRHPASQNLAHEKKCVCVCVFCVFACGACVCVYVCVRVCYACELRFVVCLCVKLCPVHKRFTSSRVERMAFGAVILSFSLLFLHTVDSIKARTTCWNTDITDAFHITATATLQIAHRQAYLYICTSVQHANACSCMHMHDSPCLSYRILIIQLQISFSLFLPHHKCTSFLFIWHQHNIPYDINTHATSHMTSAQHDINTHATSQMTS
jgi:hypothetical protein